MSVIDSEFRIPEGEQIETTATSDRSVVKDLSLAAYKAAERPYASTMDLDPAMTLERPADPRPPEVMYLQAMKNLQDALRQSAMSGGR